MPLPDAYIYTLKITGDERRSQKMREKKMTLRELTEWLGNNGPSYEIDNTGRLAVKDSLMENFRTWVKDHGYTSLPDEFFCARRNLLLDGTSLTSLGGLTFVERELGLSGTSLISLGNLTSVGWSLNLRGTPLNSLGSLTSVGETLDLEGTSVSSLGKLTLVGQSLNLSGTPLVSLDDLPQVGGELCLDQSQLQLLTRGTLKKVKKEIVCYEPFKDEWVTLSPDELGTIVAENEQRERLHNTRGSDVDWDLYDR